MGYKSQFLIDWRIVFLIMKGFGVIGSARIRICNGKKEKCFILFNKTVCHFFHDRNCCLRFCLDFCNTARIIVHMLSTNWRLF